MARVIKTVTENYTVLDGDDGGIIIGNSSSLITITMPSAIGRATFSLTVMNANKGAFMFAGVLGGVINNCGFSDGVFDVGMLCAYANVYANSVTGNAIGYGAYATNGSNIYKLGTMPTGTVANEATATAGAIR